MIGTEKYPSSHFVQFQYDPPDRVTNMIDASGTNSFCWTAGNQLLTESGPFAASTLTNSYSSRLLTGLGLQQPTSFWTNGFGYDSARRLTNVISPTSTSSYAYLSGLPSLRVKKLTLPNGAYVTNVYDTVARLLTSSLKSSGGPAFDQYAYIYNPANQRTNLTRLDGSYYGFACASFAIENGTWIFTLTGGRGAFGSVSAYPTATATLGK